MTGWQGQRGGAVRGARVALTFSALLPALLAAALATLPVAPSAAQSAAQLRAPYVPTANEIAERMLQLAQVGARDYVIDLGSGDGRLVIAAVAQFNARGGTGIEINPSLVAKASQLAASAGVADRVAFVAGDLFGADVTRATVVTLYLLPGMMSAVETKLRHELQPGARIVAHDYPLPSWPPESVVRFDSPDKVEISGSARTVLYLYRVPAR